MTEPTLGDGEGVEVLLLCSECGQVVAKPVRKHQGDSLDDGEREPAIPQGYFAYGEEVLAEGEQFYGLSTNDVVLNLNDIAGLRPCGKRIGCCGPDGSDGPNLECRSGHRVATEVSDCYQPHFVRFSLSKVRFIERGTCDE